MIECFVVILNINMLRVTCIITSAGTKRNLPLVLKCMRSLVQSAKKIVQLNIIITTENPQHIFRRGKYFYKLIVAPNNSGFVGMNNAAIEKAMVFKPEYILLINDDAWVENNFFREFVKNVDREQADIYVPFTYEGNALQLDSFGVEYFTSGYSKNASAPDIKTMLASFSCALLRTKFLTKVKKTFGFYLNPILMWYLDDVEFSIRTLAIGGKIRKNNNLVVHHLRTFTWGRKSYFVMFQSFKNALWIILLTWPKKTILRNLPSVIFVQFLTFLYSIVFYGPLMYPKLIFDTLKNLKTILVLRNKIISSYDKNYDFMQVFSPHIIRTKHGLLF